MIEKIAEATINLDIVEGGEGGSSIIYQSTEPSPTDHQSGDTWYKTDANDNVVEVYAHDGTSWGKKEYTATTLDMNSVQDSLVRVGAETGARVEIDSDSVDIYVNPSTIGATLDGENGLTVSTGGFQIVSALLKYILTLTTRGFSFINNQETTTFPFLIGSETNNVHLNTSADALVVNGEASATLGAYAEGLGANQRADIVMKAGQSEGSSIDLQADNVLVNGQPIGGGTTPNDYVVEEGAGGIYRWRKWESGRSEVWGYWHGSNTHYSTNSNWYARYFDWSFPTGVFLNPLSSDDNLPNAQFTARVGSGFSMTAGISYNSAPNTLRTYVLSSASGSQTCSVWIYATGRWK